MKAKIRNALVTWNNPPTKDWDELVAMLSPAYMVGQLERGEAGDAPLAVRCPVAEP